jgi:hypothetical protein
MYTYSLLSSSLLSSPLLCFLICISVPEPRLHLRCHLAQSLCEFGVVLSRQPHILRSITCSRIRDIPSRKTAEPARHVHLLVSPASPLQLRRKTGPHTGDGVCQFSFCPCQLSALFEPLDGIVNLALLETELGEGSDGHIAVGVDG